MLGFCGVFVFMFFTLLNVDKVGLIEVVLFVLCVFQGFWRWKFVLKYSLNTGIRS